MNKNIECLVKACETLNISYESHHKTKNLVTVSINSHSHVFLNWGTPFNSQSVAQLCQDKDYFYSYFKNIVKSPKTISFLNPYCDEKYERYLDHKTIFEVILTVEVSIAYPVIVKKNRGSWGSNVFLVNNRCELEKSLLAVFNPNSATFDYVCLVQEKINISTEYRVIYFDGEYQFAYKKNTENASFSGNISPLHWEGATVSLVDENEEITLKNFCAPMFSNGLIPYCGLDVALDTGGNLWVIEANSSPGFDYFIRDQGDSMVVKLYESMLSNLIQKS